ncbi:MAG: MipA/OmpV family protein [Bacteriovorax sp.]|nr:MipA/OmpV family protein [Bacteriovorax sp.]
MKTILLLFLLLNSLNISFAQDERTWRLSIGAGLGFKKNLRVENTYDGLDKKYILKPIPIITGSIGRFSLGPQGISVRALGNQGASLSAFIKREGDRYHGVGMDDKKDSVFAGLSAKFFKYGLNFSKDIGGRSHGHLVQVSYGEFYPLSENFVLRAGAGLEWMDDRFAEYYYSVRKTEVTSTRNEYHLNNSLQPGVNILSIYKLNSNTSLTGALSAKLIPKDVRKSPTMNGDKIDFGGLVGMTYTL